VRPITELRALVEAAEAEALEFPHEDVWWEDASPVLASIVTFPAAHALIVALSPAVVRALLAEVEAGRALRDAVRDDRYVDDLAINRCQHPKYNAADRCCAEATRSLYCDDHAAEHGYDEDDDCREAPIARALKAYDAARKVAP
jgi:hypothetical protein